MGVIGAVLIVVTVVNVVVELSGRQWGRIS